MKPRLLVDARARLGECPLWCERAGALYWTDIESATLHCWQAADGRLRRWTLPERLGSFALCADDSQLLLGLASGIALFDLARETLSPIVPVDAEQPGTRINDGRCDRQGRFVFGMFNPAEAPIGHFYRVHPDLRVERLPLPPVAVGNSIAFSPDGTTMYFTDSPTRTIQRVDYGADGRIGTPRSFVQLPASDGFADGSTVDAEGGLWNAQWRGARVVRYDAAGVESARFEVPASQLTCPAFGGAALDQLYLTSARAGLDPAALEKEPGAGGVFVLQPGWRGLPEPRFAHARSTRRQEP
ncbi:SMP-30/gluconolactonase/LRE family protein [Variovorax saccharolyticus]|uniref:SMP-30/gluconolactonase/LRE family protein n=1 Tax=Variovorax saccharolyticus TaxID=3053516 RepID=UPI002578A755|nr:SMP-30/gluconolactonase/LRE family protein [Variovorax sp. J22R187]MDM0019510.1 SMP-30/gluconolactonase/LRE family protein [Variovorax sp. J22R187]